MNNEYEYEISVLPIFGETFFNTYIIMKQRFIISGGGTGGHIFPAVAIANQLKKEVPNAEILFIGANHKMEMTKVPEAGYPIKGLNIQSFQRGFSISALLHNLRLPYMLWKSVKDAKAIIKKFKPDAVIGVGGYASGPALLAANALKVPTLIQEQNSFPGKTNKYLAKKASKICVAYEGLEQYFPKEKLVLTGNPVREEIIALQRKEQKAFDTFSLSPHKKTLLVMGGSLGARSINRTMLHHLETLQNLNIQIIWQTGGLFYDQMDDSIKNKTFVNIRIVPFIKQMNHAYSVADYIVSRAGALAIAELTIVGTPTILVPFPYASEDHQTFNAKALSENNAAILLPDNRVEDELMSIIQKMIDDPKSVEEMAANVKKFAKPDAIHLIVHEILEGI